MLVFGKVSNVNENDYTVKLKLEEYDDETPWLIIPQLWTRNNKSGWLPELQTLCCAYLSEDMTEGFLVSANYNDEDTIMVEFKGKEFIRFSDGVVIEHTPGSGQLKIKADKVIFDCEIICTKDISDKNGTIQSIRDWANQHQHTNGNNGGNTGSPTEEI